MRTTQSRFFRALAVTMAFATANLAAPQGVIALMAPDPNAPKPAPEPEKKAPKRTRLLSAKAMRTSQGRVGGNPYLAGQNKWDVVYKGVNLMTGAYTMSATDLSYEGGYGIPVSVTRSYNSNNPDEGPMGWGWVLSVDTRSTVGGLIKSSGSPVRSVPLAFKERPTADNDPRIADANEPVEAVVATDSGGQEETIQKDVDGILTPPPWDKNVIDSEYEYVTMPGGSVYRVLKKNVVRTIDGTVYEYSKHGSYPNGLSPRSGGVSGEASNVLKIDKAIDRHGNQTLYTYASTGQVAFAKSNGTVTEDRLTEIKMPNGHHIAFEWTGNRITKAKDLAWGGTTVLREVNYAYTGGKLTSVTTPGGKVTTFGYGNSVFGASASSTIYTDLLRTITDPRGLTTTLYYVSGRMFCLPGYGGIETAAVYRIDAPNGAKTYLYHNSALAPSSDQGPEWDRYAFRQTHVSDVDSTGAITNSFGICLTSFDVDMVQISVFDDAYEQDWNYCSSWKSYRISNQDLVWEQKNIFPLANRSVSGASNGLAALLAARRPVAPSWAQQRIETTSEYNFMGNPLENSVVEPTKNAASGIWSSTPAKTADYAYWGADKYFQQKAIRTKKDAAAYRYSFTDYYDANSSSGLKGSKKEVYDSKYAVYNLGANWKYDIMPAAGSHPLAKFPLADGVNLDAYDAKGRIQRVLKLSKVVGSTPTYIETRSTYGADYSGSWGQVAGVTEAVGTASARSTYTLAYTADGKPSQVRDANLRITETNFGLDGEVNWVKRIDSGLNQTLASYTYGTSGIQNGQLISVTDGLSGVSQTFSYITSGGGLGQVGQVDQSGGGLPSFTVAYAYNPSGERSEATFITPEGNSKWGYSDYERVGDPTSGQRVFQTLRKLNASTSAGTSEEFHYVTDSTGRLTNVMFGQTPQLGSGAPVSAPYYTNAYPASTRYQACYEADPGGRVRGIYHRWDQWNGSSYAGTPVLANECQFDAVKGLKTQSQTLVSNTAGNAWSIEGTESFSYESERDVLLSADYDANGPGVPETWVYDAAGNRANTNYTYDALNRMTTSPGYGYTYDAVGNRLSKGGTAWVYTWDVRNRMASYTRSGQPTANYTYRTDGIRVGKSVGATSTLYRHDGQMPMQEVETIGGTVNAVTDFALGGRGVDAISRTTSSGTIVRYPLYDAHGDTVGTVGSSGPSSLTDRRSYDAWGGVRSGSTTGAPNVRYGASVGHQQDDESGLIYMRARYYEPSTGRFLSEDSERDGRNWYVYCGNNPISLVDPSGGVGLLAIFGCLLLLAALGAIVGALSSVIKATTSGEQLKLDDLMSNVIAGAVAGLIGGGLGLLIGGGLGAAAIGALIGAFATVVADAIGGYFGTKFPKTDLGIPNGLGKAVSMLGAQQVLCALELQLMEE